MTDWTGRERPTAFVRRYAKTWVHALATAALTAFGTLTVVDERFAAVAIAAYALPPVVLYLTGGSNGEPAAAGAGSPSNHAAAGDTDPPTGDTGPSGGGDDSPPSTPDSPPSDADSSPATTDPSTPDTRSDPEPRWTTASVPTDVDLHDVAVAGAGAYAVGDDGVLLRTDGDGWSTLLPDGPRAGGRIRRGVYREGAVDWAEPVKPGSGSSVAGVALRDDSVGFVCDTSRRTFRTADGGRTFTEVDGDVGAGTTTDVAATASGAVLSTDEGVVYDGNGGS